MVVDLDWTFFKVSFLLIHVHMGIGYLSELFTALSESLLCKINVKLYLLNFLWAIQEFLPLFHVSGFVHTIFYQKKTMNDWMNDLVKFLFL